MFKITDNQFRMTLDNGYVISIVNGEYTYADNRDGTASDTVEVWAFRDDEKHGDPIGYLRPNEVLAYINEVAAL
jgi:hypothetical protein